MNLKYGKAIMFLVILIGHFFIFPRFFYHEFGPNRINCGLPILGITLAFWGLGGGTAIIVHAIYNRIRRLKI